MKGGKDNVEGGVGMCVAFFVSLSFLTIHIELAARGEILLVKLWCDAMKWISLLSCRVHFDMTRRESHHVLFILTWWGRISTPLLCCVISTWQGGKSIPPCHVRVVSCYFDVTRGFPLVRLVMLCPFWCYKESPCPTMLMQWGDPSPCRTIMSILMWWRGGFPSSCHVLFNVMRWCSIFDTMRTFLQQRGPPHHCVVIYSFDTPPHSY